jgi:hypothetical protein
MFLDENAVPAVSPAQIEDWRRALLDAADYLERVGWIQGCYFEYDADDVAGPACMVGAIVGPIEDYSWHNMSNVHRKAITHVAKNLWDVVESTDAEDCLTGWNDHKDRTKEEVIAKLREVARS